LWERHFDLFKQWAGQGRGGVICLRVYRKSLLLSLVCGVLVISCADESNTTTGFTANNVPHGVDSSPGICNHLCALPSCGDVQVPLAVIVADAAVGVPVVRRHQRLRRRQILPDRLLRRDRRAVRPAHDLD